MSIVICIIINCWLPFQKNPLLGYLSSSFLIYLIKTHMYWASVIQSCLLCLHLLQSHAYVPGNTSSSTGPPSQKGRIHYPCVFKCFSLINPSVYLEDNPDWDSWCNIYSFLLPCLCHAGTLQLLVAHELFHSNPNFTTLFWYLIKCLHYLILSDILSETWPV